MNTRSKTLTILVFIVVALGLFLYFSFDLLEFGAETDLPIDDTTASSLEPPAVVSGTFEEDEIADYEHEELERISDAPRQARTGMEPEGEKFFCIRGKAVMKDGSALPADLGVTCLHDETPFASRSSPDFGERHRLESRHKKADLPTTVPDQNGAFLLMGLPEKNLYLQVMAPFLRPATSVSATPKPFKAEDSSPHATLVLEKAGVVEGKVLKPDGKPAEEAEIMLRGEFNPFFMLSQRKSFVTAEMTETDGQGGFRFEQVPVGSNLVLDVKAEGFSPIRNRKVEVKPGQAVHIDVELVPGCSICGMVVDASGQPAPEISVAMMSSKLTISDPLSMAPNDTETDKEGLFEFADLLAGSYNVILKEQGYIRTAIKGVKVTGGERREGLKFTLDRGLSITGIVVNGNDEPVHRARIKLEKELNLLNISARITESMSPLWCRSDEEGKFELAGLDEGVYDMEVKADDYFLFKQKSVSAGTAGLRVELGEGGVISGIVISAATGEAVTPYKIRMEQTSGGESSILDPMGIQNMKNENVRDDKGKFHLGGLLPGEFDLVFKAKSFGAFELKGVTISPGEDARGIIVALPDESVIAGMVVDAITGEPVQGASITQESGIMGMIKDMVDEGSTITDEQGRFKVGGLSAGKARLVVNHGNYEEKSIEDIALAEGQKLEGLEIALSRGSTIRGHVLDENRKPLAGATIFVTTVTASVFKTVATDEEGYYEVNGLSKGNYAVQKMPDRFGIDTAAGEDWLGSIYKDLQVKTIRLKKDEVVDCDFLLGDVNGAGTKVFGVVKENGQRKRGVIVQMTVIDSSGGLNSPLTSTTNKEGEYSFNNVQPGDYRLFISNISGNALGSYSLIDFEVSVPQRSEYEFDVDLPGAAISGRVRDKRTLAPLSGVRVILLNNDAKAFDDFMTEVMGSRVAEIYTNSEGRFKVTNLREGRYNLRAGGANAMGMDSGGYAFLTMEDIKIRKGEHKDGLVLSLEKGGDLEGYITDARGDPVNGASIHLMGPGQPSYGSHSEIKTDATGHYKYSGLLEGKWSVKVEHPEHPAREDSGIWIETEKETMHSVALSD